MMMPDLTGSTRLEIGVEALKDLHGSRLTTVKLQPPLTPNRKSQTLDPKPSKPLDPKLQTLNPKP